MAKEISEKEKASNDVLRKEVLFGSLLYGLLGVVAIIIPVLNKPIVMEVVYIGMAIVAYAIIQTLWVMLRENLSKFEKVVLIIINLPVYIVYEIGTF